MSNFELRILPFIDSKDSLTDVEMGRLGKKNPNEYPLHYNIFINTV